MTIRLSACVLAVLLLVVMAVSACAQQTDFAEAVGFMKREQALGEANAGLLKTFAVDDTSTYARGIQLYALAQADFNALIETMKAGLIAGGDLPDSKEFSFDLERAATRRVEFTDFVEEKVLSQHELSTKSLAAALGGADIITVAADLITALMDAGVSIWREYKEADREQRRQILDQLDSLQWRSFGDVPAVG